MKLRTVFYRFMKLLGKRFFLYMFCIIVMTMSQAGITIALSYLLNEIIDSAKSGNIAGLGMRILWIIIFAIVSLFVWRTSTVCYNIEAKRGVAKMEKMVFSKSMRMPMTYYEVNHSGDFMSKLIYDTNKAGDIYGSRLRRIVAPILSVITFLIPMCMMCWQLTICLVSVNIVLLIINTLFIKPMKNLGIQLSKKNAVMTEKLTNMISGVDLIKIFAAGSKLTTDYKAANEDFLKTQKKKIAVSASLYSMTEGFNLLSALCFLALGVEFVAKGYTTIGQLAGIYAMYGAFSWHFLQIGRYMPEMTNSLANAQKVLEFLDLEAEPLKYEIDGVSDAMKIDDAPETNYVVFENVKFGYSKKRKVLDGFSMIVKKGTTVALTGESGKGKSTLAKILLGFYKPQSGRITINGKGFSEYTLEEIRDMIAYVPQEPYLYGVSIAENIAYGKKGATMEEIEKAAKAANAHDFIINLEDGYNTLVGERGNRLSGGEKQRIAIARAILKDAPILFLDEATSALDNESERLVSEAIENLMEGRTTIMIAHRPSTIARANVVISM